MIVVNFKAYNQATGSNSRKIAQQISSAAREIDRKVIITPSAPDLTRMDSGDLKIFSQHADPVKPGSQTGHLTVETLKEAGVSGTLLNHSERRLDHDTIKETVERTREKDLKTVVCAQSPGECRELSSMKPDFVAYEPPELIGGDVSVSEAKPELIEEAVEMSDVPVLTGAGIKSRKDVEKSRELGARGILVASGVVKAEKPGEKVKELAGGL